MINKITCLCKTFLCDDHFGPSLQGGHMQKTFTVINYNPPI